MPEEPKTGRPTTEQINQQIQKLHRYLKAKVRSAALEWLIDFQRRGQFDRKFDLTAKDIYQKFYEHSVELNVSGKIHKDDLTEKQEMIAARVKKLFGDLADDLDDYYTKEGATDPVIIRLQRGHGWRFEPLIEYGSEKSPPSPPDQKAQTLTDPEGARLAASWFRAEAGVTIFPNWDKFEELLDTVERDDNQPEDLRIITMAFTSGGPPEDKLQELAERGVRIKILLTDPTAGEPLVRARNKIRSTSKDGDGETPDYALDALRKQIVRLENLRNVVMEKKRKGYTGDFEVCLSDLMPYGFVAHTSKWIVLGLFLATCSYGLGPMIVIDAATNKTFWEKLKADWDARSIDAASPDEVQRQGRLAEHSEDRDGIMQQIISDSGLITAIEAHIPAGNIWVASPDLSNVGDQMSRFSELVRRVVRENASRGVNYTYICPQARAGDSRLDNLNECFVGTSGKLFLHQVPAERFLELTLVPTHFISFNPLDSGAYVYMQLPLSRARKGWLKLDRKDSARVIAKMKQLISEYSVLPREQV